MSDTSEAEKVLKSLWIGCGCCQSDESEKENVKKITQALAKAGQEKVLTWFQTPNPQLGNVSPIDMIRIGRGEKLCKWIDQTIREGEYNESHETPTNS